ncbi:MAG: GDSL-type esterase/lipase family protein [Oscillospiraceae bacterium]|nr:GDSL-type esterase/lipase family protein [Oscillospiraceae bacterium]
MAAQNSDEKKSGAVHNENRVSAEIQTQDSSNVFYLKGNNGLMLSDGLPAVTVPVIETTPVKTETQPPMTEPPATQGTQAQTASPPQVTTQPVQPPADSGYDFNSPVPECERANDDYFASCAFIGDSHINAFKGYSLAPEDRVFAKNGMNISQVYDYVDLDAVSSVSPSNIYIMFGTNGVMWMSWDSMITQYRELINKLKEKNPNAKIYILSIPPVTADRENMADIASGKMLNSDINDYNNRLLGMAGEEKVYFADLNSAVKNDQGCLISSSDGVHMSADLYSNQVKTYILTHIVK